MPISGVVITLSPDASRAEAALTALATDTRVATGERRGRRVAATVDTADRDEDRHVWQWMNELSGVDHVDVVFVGFDQEAAGMPVTEGGP